MRTSSPKPGENPIGLIWDQLVESEELDLQVKSLGNVYTPKSIVRTLVDKAQNSIESWQDVKVLEPACGSGHFVREVYSKMLNAHLGGTGTPADIVAAHNKVIGSLRALDIDPFAVQSTQLGMFLELYKSKDVWRGITENGTFDLSGVVSGPVDFLSEEALQILQSFKPNVIIGNPPYGVSVTDETADNFSLQSKDSYGYFIARSIDLLDSGGSLLFVVSSSFLTTKSHQQLREKIYKESIFKSIMLCHRNTFPGRDVFCCLMDLRKIDPNEALMMQQLDGYRFVDAWPIKPQDPDFSMALRNWSGAGTEAPKEDRFGDYIIPFDLVSLRLFPPSAHAVTKILAKKPKVKVIHNRYASARKNAYPFFGGAPSLYLLTADVGFGERVKNCPVSFPGYKKEKDGLEISRESGSVKLVKLWQISQVLQGLATADDERFLRKSVGVVPNARRRNIKDVAPQKTLDSDQLAGLSEDHKRNGIPIVDAKTERYFVPFDKGGEQDVELGQTRAFWSPVDYWINWSRNSVTELKRRNRWKPGTPKKPRFQNAEHYFENGIRFSPAGLYAPVFELGFGGVFGHKGSLIIPFDTSLTTYLISVLTCPLIKYLAKNFLQHTVMTEIDTIRQIPIAVPSVLQLQRVEQLANRVIELKKNGELADQAMADVWRVIYQIYGISPAEESEITTWFRRRYHLFGRSAGEAQSTNSIYFGVLATAQQT